MADDPNRDLGFGSVVARQSRKRLLNRDGSFNVVREGLKPFESLSVYHYLLTVSWPRFLTLLALAYLGVNAVFGLAYALCGAGELQGMVAETLGERLLGSFFFSVQTFATIGYGAISPHGLAAHLLVTLESLVGLLGFALATGLLFARVSRPTAKILFSEAALIAPYRGITAFEFRIANARSSQLIEVGAKVLFVRQKPDGGRDFVPLTLERDRVTFFTLSWTIVHPIDETSPLWGMTEEDFKRCDVEFLVLLTGFDETFSQTVHTRSSYKGEEVIWGASFASLFNPVSPDGVLSVDIGRLHAIEKRLPPAPAAARGEPAP
jgi:inward rectifier potassium channel